MANESLTNNQDRHRYEISVDGTLAGFAEYNLLEGAVLFTHTEILEAFEGKGLGSKLARYALDDVRAKGVWAIPVCKFIAGYIHKHPEYIDLVKPEVRRAFQV
jgi:hypothetical protein